MPRRAKGRSRSGVARYRGYDSKREHNRAQELELLEAGGVIRDLRKQVRFPLELGGIEIRYVPSGRQASYVADFVYFDTTLGCEVIEDSKGQRTEMYKIKQAIMHAMGYTITET